VVAVLDASAFLAFMLDEPGAEVVQDALTGGAVLSAVNFAESLSRLADLRPDLAQGFGTIVAQLDPETLPPSLPGLGAGAPVLPRNVTVAPFTLPDAITCAALRPVTRPKGLSLGDRACIALGRRLHAPVFTADRSWLELDLDALAVDVRLVR
jgi:PIN domain nuclease of toxin-antitoxin system